MSLTIATGLLLALCLPLCASASTALHGIPAQPTLIALADLPAPTVDAAATTENFWSSGPAYAIYVLAGGLLFFGVHQLRVRTLRAHNRHLERLVRERTRQLEQADAAKNTFVAHLSHEIRNPINGILGASLALELKSLTPSQNEEVKTIRHCSLFLSSLVDDVLDIMKLESGTLDRRQASYNPRDLVAMCRSMLASQAETNGVTLTPTVGESVPALVMGDAGRVQQILVNFTLNAIKFSAPGPVDISLQAEGGWLHFAVADRGPGIAAADKEKLFNSFSRLGPAKKSQTAGSGLGLAVSRALATHLGGTVGLQDRDGGGSIFWLRLPLETATPALATNAGTAEFVGARALIIEDVDYNATALTFMLQQIGFHCDRAASGNEALRRLSTQRYDSVFVDYDLPDMNGGQLVRRAKQEARPGDNPLFIATTAYATTAIRQTCLEAGMDAFVTKPITPERLRQALLTFAGPLQASASVQLPRPAQLTFELIDYLSSGTEQDKKNRRQEFFTLLDETVQTMANSIPLGHREVLRRSAHQLVGHARLIGAESLATLAEQLEQKAYMTPLPGLHALITEIEAQTRALNPTGGRQPQTPATA